MSDASTSPVPLQRRLATSATAALLLKGTSIGITILLQAILARLLAPAEYGTFVLGLSVAGIAVTLGGIGLRQGTIVIIGRLDNPVDRPNLAGMLQVIALALVGNGVVGAALWLFGGPLLAVMFSNHALVGVLAPLALFVVVTGVQIVVAESFRAVRNVSIASLLATQFSGGSVLSTALLLAGVIALWRFDAVTLEAVWWAGAAAAIFTIILGFALAGRPFGRRRLAVGRTAHAEGTPVPARRVGASQHHPIVSMETVRVLAPLWATNLLLFALSQTGLWLLGNRHGGTEVALYGAASRLVTLIATPLLVANAVLPGYITQLHGGGDTLQLERTLRRTSTLAAYPALAILALVLIFAKPILGLVYGNFYAAAAPALIALAAGQAINVWSGSTGIALMLTDHRMDMLVVTIIGSILTVVLAILLVDRYGALGAAIATAAGLAIQNLAAVLATRIRLGVWTQMYSPSRLLRSRSEAP